MNVMFRLNFHFGRINIHFYFVHYLHQYFQFHQMRGSALVYITTLIPVPEIADCLSKYLFFGI